MPTFPLVDTHVHLWAPGHLRYPWLAGVPALNRPHGVAEFRNAIGSVAVSKIVFVQCECDPSQSQAEAAWVAALAGTEPRLSGIVAQAALENGEAVVPALAQLAETPLVRGVRRLLQEEDDAFCRRPEFVRGVRALAQFGFSCDLCIHPRQLPAATELVQACPEIRFVLDHLGKPPVREGRIEPWRTQLRALSRLENVVCKLSGLATEADWRMWRSEDLRPYLEHALDCFGVGRVMFGGDWPVSTQATDYPRWVETVDDALRGCSNDELRQVYVHNGEAFYRL